MRDILIYRSNICSLRMRRACISQPTRSVSRKRGDYLSFSLSPVSYMLHEGQYEPAEILTGEATIFDPQRDKGSIGATAGPTARIMCGASWCLARGPHEALPVKAPRARNIKRGLSCSREWRILCRFRVDRAPDSIAISSLCPVPG